MKTPVQVGQQFREANLTAASVWEVVRLVDYFGIPHAILRRVGVGQTTKTISCVTLLNPRYYRPAATAGEGEPSN